jgi:hypothetical protein
MQAWRVVGDILSHLVAAHRLLQIAGAPCSSVMS